jgi:hypothetical protein
LYQKPALSVMAGLVPAVHAIGQTAVLENTVAPLMPSVRWSSENEAERHGAQTEANCA